VVRRNSLSPTLAPSFLAVALSLALPLPLSPSRSPSFYLSLTHTHTHTHTLTYTHTDLASGDEGVVRRDGAQHRSLAQVSLVVRRQVQLLEYLNVFVKLIQLLCRNVQRFRGGLVSKAHRLCVSLNSRPESDNNEEGWGLVALVVRRQAQLLKHLDRTVKRIRFWEGLECGVQAVGVRD